MSTWSIESQSAPGRQGPVALGGGHGLVDGQPVVLSSDWGSLTVDVEIDGALRPGVVLLEHGWGRQAGLRRSAAAPGVNVNAVMPSGAGSYEQLSNQQQLSGVPVTVSLVGA